ncbi:MAG: ATP-dependent 6-phosphofructokinase [Lentisphaeria bacterium]|nr:ATP-dependent 6-phosphofructokinase [Lentisphaeria bacterium]
MDTVETTLPYEEVQGLDFGVERVGEPGLDSPLHGVRFVDDDAGVSFYADAGRIAQILAQGSPLPAFAAAGPRRRLYHDAPWTRAAIVTCGGLCPGLNDVIKALVNTLFLDYGVDSVFGIPYGYRGLVPGHGLKPIELTPDLVDGIHEDGGSILKSSRGPQSTEEIVKTLDRLNIGILFTIGGDGTQRGARDIVEEARKRGLSVSIIGIPKTIDNDLDFMERTFGFETAIYAAAPVISSAHVEAKDAYNGIGLVRLMGRDSGFIAAYATLANSVVNFCLIPEVPFALEGPGGFLPVLEHRLAEKQHAVIVVAEGAGQDLFADQPQRRDSSGNVLHHDIGLFLKDRIRDYLQSRGIEHSIKYFDPSYLIRSVPARGTDAIFCLHLAQHAVHAAMAGFTNMVVGYWNGHFVHIPMALATRQRRRIDPRGQLWQSVLAVTRQQAAWQAGCA